MQLDKQVYEKLLNFTNYQGNADQNHNETELLTLREKKKKINVGKDMQKR